MSITMAHAAMRDAIRDVDRARERLERGKAKAEGEVDALLGGAWSGVAADSFRTAWDDWRAAAEQVRAGLDATAQLLDAVHRDMVEQDTGSEQAMHTVASRIVERLG
ncbi:WXG100 family type VII secretion target [Nocardioides sp. SOB77]|uniref:ESAT-6-like protein n=1 Tax=Nocardioides oceani TaxID=3058369 RepID=A0ABT8FFU6_9ACTN|nr:WXG100 family type VII secretion target [Nocardioides oceani]MDN4173315.1 WXG100 family type VII secretion target [Nocardioides oceani]